MTRSLEYYQVLGLDAPPADRKAVKRAYSKKLKVTRPEDDPDGFMRLRDAHDMALNILARETANAAWRAEQALYEPPPAAQPEANPTTELETSELETGASGPSLTYEDMLPETQSSSETSYAIGPSPSLDAPAMPSENNTANETQYFVGATPNLHAPITRPTLQEPKTPPLMDVLDTILEHPKKYNDRESWNRLFRAARQLDIDDYVDFEYLLLESVLRFHDYYDHTNPLHDTPEKMPQRLSPSIAASLFKTMSWDQVSKHGNQRSYQIEWLSRRMIMRNRTPDAVPIPQTQSNMSSGTIWKFLIGIFIVVKIIQFLANS